MRKTILIVPLKFKSVIQIVISNHIMKSTTRGQLVKSLVLKGWSLESAEILVDGLKENGAV